MEIWGGDSVEILQESMKYTVKSSGLTALLLYQYDVVWNGFCC